MHEFKQFKKLKLCQHPHHIYFWFKLLTCTKSIFTNFLATFTNFLALCYFSSFRNRFSFVFSSSGMQQSHHIVKCHATGINYLFISFLHALHCLYLLHQAVSLTRIIVSGSSMSKLTSSMLTLLTSVLTRPISPLKMWQHNQY